MAGIRKESGLNPYPVICKLFNFHKCSVLYLVIEFDLNSNPSKTCRQIQHFLYKLNVRYREHILTTVVPILFKLEITANMNSCVNIICDFKITLPRISLNNSINDLPLNSLPRKFKYIRKWYVRTYSKMVLSLQILFPRASVDTRM